MSFKDMPNEAWFLIFAGVCFGIWAMIFFHRNKKANPGDLAEQSSWLATFVIKKVPEKIWGYFWLVLGLYFIYLYF